MKIPANAVIAAEKLTQYLLAPRPKNDKSRFLAQAGFTQTIWIDTWPDVEKIELGNNQFGVKYRILRQEPARRFLLYHAGPPPANLDNWLLDAELVHGRFRADQIALWLTELGLGLEFADVIAPHAEFFRAERRRQSLHKLLKADDTPRQPRLTLLAVCANAEARLAEILEQLLAELAAGKDERMGIYICHNQIDASPAGRWTSSAGKCSPTATAL